MSGNISENLEEYVALHSAAEPEVLQQIARATHLNVLNPHMLSGHLQGRLLAVFSRMIRPRRILELGTYTGYSALCLAEGVQQEVVTVERNDELETVIRQNLALSPEGGKVRLLIGDCLQVVPQLSGEFDLVFIDADKREYLRYLDLVLDKVPSGGWILADNTLWDGHVIDPAYDRDRQTLALREFNDRVAADPRLDPLVLPLRDGLTVIRKRAL